MISRNFIRIKVLEAIYAYRASHCTDVFAAEKRLEHAMEDFYALFLKLLALFPALARMDSKILELKKGRMLPTEEDLKHMQDHWEWNFGLMCFRCLATLH